MVLDLLLWLPPPVIFPRISDGSGWRRALNAILDPAASPGRRKIRQGDGHLAAISRSLSADFGRDARHPVAEEDLPGGREGGHPLRRDGGFQVICLLACRQAAKGLVVSRHRPRGRGEDRRALRDGRGPDADAWRGR